MPVKKLAPKRPASWEPAAPDRPASWEPADKPGNTAQEGLEKVFDALETAVKVADTVYEGQKKMAKAPFQAAYKGITKAQKGGAEAVRSLMQGDMTLSPLGWVLPPDTTVPNPSTLGLTDVNLTPRVADTMPEWMRLLLLRGAQMAPGMSMSLGSTRAEDALADEAATRKAVEQLEAVPTGPIQAVKGLLGMDYEKAGPRGAAMLQTAAMAPAMLAQLPMATSRSASTLARVGINAARNALIEAEEGFFAAPEGQRGKAASAAMFLGGLLGGASGLIKPRGALEQLDEITNDVWSRITGERIIEAEPIIQAAPVPGGKSIHIGPRFPAGGRKKLAELAKQPPPVSEKIKPEPPDPTIPPEVDKLMRAQAAAKQMSDNPVPEKLPNLPLAQAIRSDEAALREFSQLDKRTLAKLAALPEQRAAGRGAHEVAAYIRDLHGAQQMQDVQAGHLFPMSERALKKDGGKEARKLAERWIAQNKDPSLVTSGKMARVTADELKAAIPEWAELFSELQRDMAGDTLYALKKGLFTPEQIKNMEEHAQNGYTWLHVAYMQNIDGKFTPPIQHFTRAVDIVQRKQKKLTRDQAQAYVWELIKQHGDARSPEARFRESRLNKEILKSRKQIPPWIRRVMGEVTDPSFVLAQSVSEVGRLVRHFKVTEAIVKDPTAIGKAWSPKYVQGMDPRPLWTTGLSDFENRKLYGELAGKYVAPELREAIMAVPRIEQMNLLMEGVTTVVQAFKFSKVGLNPATWLRDFVGNTTSMAAAGLPIWHKNAGPQLEFAAKVIVDYHNSVRTPKSILKPERPGQWLIWAYEDSALRPGIGAEFAGGSKMRAIALDILGGRREGALGIFDSILAHTRKTAADIGAAREMADTLPRLAVYMEQAIRGTNDLNLPIEAARARASRIVNENFVSAGNISHAVRAISRFGGALVNPFLSWYADAIRVHANWARNSVNPGSNGMGYSQIFNVLQHYALILGVVKGVQVLEGITDEEIQAGEAMLRKGWRDFNPFYIWLAARDEMGRAQAVTLNNVILSASFFQGKYARDDFPLLKLVSSLWMKPFEGSVMESEASAPLQALGLSDKPFEGYAPLPTQEDESAMKAITEFIAPGLVTQAMEAGRRAQLWGNLRRYEEPLTPTQAVSKLTVLPIEPVGERSSEGERQRLNAGRKEAQRLLPVTRKREDLSDEDREKVLKEIRRRIEDYQRQQGERSMKLDKGSRKK